MQRHDALRTSIELHGDGPLQRVHHTLPAPEIYEVDMEPAVRAIGRAEALRAIVERQVERGFGLERGPLWARSLARLDAATSCLVLTAHHLVRDSTSLEIVLQDLAELYEATCARRAPQLPVPVTVRELLAAESARASSGGLADPARAVLDAPPLHLELPLDHPRPSAPTYRAERVTWAMPEPLATEVLHWPAHKRCLSPQSCWARSACSCSGTRARRRCGSACRSPTVTGRSLAGRFAVHAHGPLGAARQAWRSTA